MAHRHTVGWSDEAEIAFRRHLDFLVFGHQDAANHRHPVLLMDEGDDMLWSRTINPYSKHAFEFFVDVKKRVSWATSKIRFIKRSQNFRRPWEYQPSAEEVSEMIWGDAVLCRTLIHKIESTRPNAPYLVESTRLEQVGDAFSERFVYCEISRKPRVLKETFSPRLVIAAASRETADGIMTFATLAAQ